jgi:uncharacterized OsmC-like protein
MTAARRTLVVRARLENSYRCEVTAGRHRFTVDEPVAAGGEDAGPQPTELLLGALASCFAMALYHVAARRGIDLGAVDVEATGTYAGPSFSGIHLRVRTESEPEALDGLLERARSVCYVSNTLARSPDLTVEVVGPQTVVKAD